MGPCTGYAIDPYNRRMRIPLGWPLTVMVTTPLLLAACAGREPAALASQSVPTPTPRPDELAVTSIPFPDQNLEAAIRHRLDKQRGDVIRPEEMANLFELDASGRSIVDLTGIEQLSNLADLDLGVNLIKDLSPLASLTDLNRLWLGDNLVSDITPLASLSNLTVLFLGGNQIADISPLALLTRLTDLGPSRNLISDISPLARLVSLDRLFLGANQIGDIGALGTLTNLTGLGLSANAISDISPLVGLTSLSGLNLHCNRISDISPLLENSGLGEGDQLFLGNNHLDLSEGSEDLENIGRLRMRGATVDSPTQMESAMPEPASGVRRDRRLQPVSTTLLLRARTIQTECREGSSECSRARQRKLPLRRWRTLRRI